MRVAGSDARIRPRPMRSNTAQEFETTFDDQLARLEALILKYPGPSIAAALGVGLLLGIVFGRR